MTKLSTRFKNGVMNKDIALGINRVHKAYHIDKDMRSAIDHMEYFLLYCTVEQINEFVKDKSNLAYKEDKRWAKIQEEVPFRIPEKLAIEKEIEEKNEAISKLKGMHNSFKAMTSFVECVAGEYSNGLFIAGPGGTGKTWTVNEKLVAMGKKEIDTTKIVDDGEDEGDFVVVKGFSSPMGLYTTLHNYRDKLIVFDDCDEIFKPSNLTGLNILKAVLDTYPVRRVSWNSTRMPDGLEKSFDFTGQIIFISNMNPRTAKSDNFRAVMTRVLSVVAGGTKEEVRDRIIELIPKVAAVIDQQGQEELKDFIEKNYKIISDLSIRFLVHISGLYQSHPDSWKELAGSMADGVE